MTKEGTRYGLVESVSGREVITHELPGPQLQVSQTGEPQAIKLAEAKDFRKLDTPLPLDEAKLLLPLPMVSKIMCVGQNYALHVKELDHQIPAEPVIFSKPPTSLLSHGGEIICPKISERVDHEGELAIVIGRKCRNLDKDDDPRAYILGYTCLNDVTCRDLQPKDVQWTRSKGFDTFCPVGPVIQTELDPWAGVGIQTRVNGELRQDGNTRDLLFKLDVIMRYISRFCTLMPGDIIATGTPAGVGPIKPGDVVEVTVEGIGTLRNPVGDELPWVPA